MSMDLDRCQFLASELLAIADRLDSIDREGDLEKVYEAGLNGLRGNCAVMLTLLQRDMARELEREQARLGRSRS